MSSRTRGSTIEEGAEFGDSLGNLRGREELLLLDSSLSPGGGGGRG